MSEVEKILKTYYKRHPIRCILMLKNSKLSHKQWRDRSGMLISEFSYFYKKDLICQETINVDLNTSEIRQF